MLAASQVELSGRQLVYWLIRKIVINVPGGAVV